LNSFSFYGNTTIGSSSTSKNLTVTGSTTLSSASVSGSTTLGTNSTAISNIQFGNSTFSSIAVDGAGSTNYISGSTLNLLFTPTAITFGVSISSGGVIPYMPAVSYVNVPIPSTAPSGTAYSFQLYLYLPEGNNDTSANYNVSWIAIA
jgi:hypothetical protein